MTLSPLAEAETTEPGTDSSVHVRRCADPRAEGWNERVADVREGCIDQTTHVQDYNQVRSGHYEPVYLVAESGDGTPLGQLLMMRGFPGAQRVATWPGGKWATPMLNRSFGCLSWIQGPLIFDDQRFDEVHDALLACVHAYGGACMLRRASLPVYDDPKHIVAAEASMQRAGLLRRQEATFLVPIATSSDEQWDRLKSSARKSLRKLRDRDDLKVIEISTEDDVAHYWSMLVETERRGGKTVHYATLDKFRQTFWDAPQAEGVLGGLLLRTTAGTPVAGLLFRQYNGWIQELGVAYSDESIRQKIYGQDLVKWELFEWARRHACHTYDLKGVKLNSEDAKERGIYQFKAKWGGALYEYGVFSKVYAPYRAALVQRQRLSR